MPMSIEEQIVLRYAIPEQANTIWGSENWGSEKGRQQVDWRRVLELALFHDVFPSVYHHLQKSDWLRIPEQAVKKFQEIWPQHLARNIILTNELNRILYLLAQKGVEAIPLKGVVMAGLFYPDITLRSFNDLDIWIRAEEINKAGEVLRQIGYEPWFVADHGAENECDISFYRCFPLGMRLSVELHWGLTILRDYPAIPQHRWWQQAEKVWINDKRYFSLAPDDMFIYLTVKIHDASYCYLKQFVDLYQLLVHWGDILDWEYIQQTAKEIRMQDNLFFVLLTIKHLFGAKATLLSQIDHQLNRLSNFKPPMRFRFLRRVLNTQSIVSGRYGRDLRRGLCLLLNDHLTDSIASSMRILFPSTQAICARYLILPHSRKFYFYYCLNPLLITYWLLRGFVVKSSDSTGLGVLLGPVNQKVR